MWPARGRFLSLWISQVARVLGDWTLRITVFQILVQHFGSAWYLVTAVFVSPCIVLAPFYGSISNSFSKRRVLFLSSLFCLIVVTVFAQIDGYWIAALALTALGSALYGPTRFAVLSAVSQDAKIALPRVVAWTDVGSIGAIVGGATLGIWMYGSPNWSTQELMLVIIALNIVSTLTAIPCKFPSDVIRKESPIQAFIGFFRDCKRIALERPAWGSLLGLSFFQAMVTAGSGAVVTHALTPGHAAHDKAIYALLLVSAGVAMGCALASLQPHIRRGLGLVVLGCTGLVIAQFWAALGMDDAGIAPLVPSFLLGMMSGLINVPLRSAYQSSVPADARGNAMAVMYAIIYIATALLAVVLIGLASTGLFTTPRSQMWFLLGLSAIGALLAWRYLIGTAFEIVMEWILYPMYRIRGHGPGKEIIPTTGPVILIANHSAYVDPFWVGKVVPRRIKPMMTSLFYDLPGINWLMRNIVGAIRVASVTFRREAPELQDAIQVLREGGCLLLFPEGKLRRTEDQYLRKFGQGIWHILQEVPNTPVIVFWIEGGWGSAASYEGGKPFQNRKVDFFHSIDVAITEPEVLPPELLVSHRVLRRYLMERCAAARGILGLEVPVLPGEVFEDDPDEEETVSEN